MRFVCSAYSGMPQRCQNAFPMRRHYTKRLQTFRLCVSATYGFVFETVSKEKSLELVAMPRTIAQPFEKVKHSKYKRNKAIFGEKASENPAIRDWDAKRKPDAGWHLVSETESKLCQGVSKVFRSPRQA